MTTNPTPTGRQDPATSRQADPRARKAQAGSHEERPERTAASDDIADFVRLVASDHDATVGPRTVVRELTQGPSPRIVDTVVVDYAAVGSVVARWAS